MEKDKCQLILDIVWRSFHWIVKLKLLEEGRTEPSFLTLPGQKCMIGTCGQHSVKSMYPPTFLWVSGDIIYSNVFLILTFLFPYNLSREILHFGLS